MKEKRGMIVTGKDFVDYLLSKANPYILTDDNVAAVHAICDDMTVDDDRSVTLYCGKCYLGEFRSPEDAVWSILEMVAQGEIEDPAKCRCYAAGEEPPLNRTRAYVVAIDSKNACWTVLPATRNGREWTISRKSLRKFVGWYDHPEPIPYGDRFVLEGAPVYETRSDAEDAAIAYTDNIKINNIYKFYFRMDGRLR